MVSACVLIRTTHGKFDKAVKMIRNLNGVKNVFPVLGRYDVVVDIKESDHSRLGATVLRIGKLAGIVFTETLVEIEK